MRSRQTKIIGWAVGGLLLVGLWSLFGPTKLGGSTTYSIISGISMQPLLYKNDLALVRTQPSYKVDDVVLYNSPVLHKPVLHRIILIQNGNYFFRGDNNSFVDPGHATENQLVGKLWLHVPAVGGVLGWFARPWHAALLAGLTVILLAATSMTVVRHRRKRRGKPPGPDRHAAKSTKGAGGADLLAAVSSDKASRKTSPPSESKQEGPLPLHITGPPTTFALFFIVLSLAILCLVLGFSRPARHLTPLAGAYQQQGTFSYTAPVKIPTAVYPRGIVKTGDPVYAGLVDSFAINFRYRFASKFPHSIKGTTELRALLLSKTDTWQELRVLQPTTAFSGDEAVINWESSLTALYAIIDAVSAQSGSTSANYTADIQPIVNITGTVNGKPVKDRFAPALPFSIGRAVITLSDAATPAPPGATYVPPSADSARTTTLNPNQPGSIPHLTDNTVNFARYNVGVPFLRWCGFALLALTFAIGVVHDIIRRQQELLSQEELIAEHFEDLLVPVTNLRPSDDATIIEVSDFTHMAELARYLERPILYDPDSKQPLYAVDDGTNHYVFHGVGNDKGAVLASRSANATGRVTHSTAAPNAYLRRYQSKLPIRILVILIILAIIATLVTTLTAGNTVPGSNVGRSVNARQIAQLRPAGCSTLSLTTIVFKSGSSSNTVSDALIIGTSGIETLNDTGARNCIVAGGGKDNITARSTSTCIIGPTSGTTYTGCTKK
jgi:signal peptidase I